MLEKVQEMMKFTAMKKFTLPAFLLLLCSAFVTAQTYNVTVSGTVTNAQTTNPVSGQWVWVQMMGSNAMGGTWSYLDSMQTSGTGAYSFTAAVPTGIVQGSGSVWTADCGTIATQYFGIFNAPAGTNIVKNFSICGNGGGGTPCVANFQYNISGLTVTAYINFVPGGSAVWTFGNGATSSGPQTSYTYSSAGNYTLCLYLYDTSGAVCDSKCVAITVSNPGNGPWTVSGAVFMSNNNGALTSPADAEVYLIEYNQQAGTLTAIDTTTITSNPLLGGTYTFSNVPSGNYFVKSALLPADPQYWNFLPTYHTSFLFWSQATNVSVSANTSGIDIVLKQGTNPGGPGFTGGLISQGANKTGGAGDPIAGVQVMLLNLDDTPVQYTYSDVNGAFSFSNVAYGTYQIYAEVMGKATTPIVVTLSAQNPSIANIHIWVTGTAVVVGQGLEILHHDQMNVFPNPASEFAYAEITSSNPTIANIRICDMTGRLVFSSKKTLIAGLNLVALPVSEFRSGIYYVETDFEDFHSVRKILKY